MFRIKLISLNIEGNKHLELVSQFLRKEQAHVVCLQEVFETDINFIKGNSYKYHYFVPMKRYSPFTSAKGLLTLSMLAPEKSTIEFYQGHKETIPVLPKGMQTANLSLLTLTIKKQKDVFRFINTHFAWSSKAKTTQLQRTNLKRMLSILTDIKQFILCGDFNSPRGGEIWSELARYYHDNVPSYIESTIDSNLHRKKGLKLVVDGIFSTKQYGVRDVTIQKGISDHKALVSHVFLKS